MSHLTNFADHLFAEGHLSESASLQLKSLALEKESSMLSIAMRTGLLPENTLLTSFSSFTGWPLISRTELETWAPKVLDSLGTLNIEKTWSKGEGLALKEEADSLHCVTRDQISYTEVLRIKSNLYKKPVVFHICNPTDLDGLYNQLDDSVANTVVSTGDLAHLRELAEEGPIVELVNSLLSQSVTRKASDIHIEPEEKSFVTRIRVDGIMRELQTHSKDKFDATVCRIKILSQLDIAERRLPQDGRLTARVHGETFDVRVSILPGAQGESVVLRLLRQDRPDYNLSDLGMLDDHAQQFLGWIQAPNGIVLVTGPTGSGKTTTLYTALNLGNDGLKKIITVEDPVEYKLSGITQLQVNADIGYTFASALRSILRHDPDIILIGEIRDQETASIAVQSALTGHLVFSTLHTNSAAGAITRLSDMGIERFLLSSSLRGIMAQRLVRRLCPHCSAPQASTNMGQLQVVQNAYEKFSNKNNLSERPNFREPVGCDECLHTGYSGRIAVYELFDVDDTIRQQTIQMTPEVEIIRQLRDRGVRSMSEDGLLKVWQGITTVAEVMALDS
jgi:general secretion pathway protein E